MRAAALTAIASTAWLGLACDRTVAGLSTEAPLIATVHGNVVASLLRGFPERLRAGIMWTGVPVYVPYCHEHGFTPADPQRDVSDTALYGCTSPFDTVAGVMGPSVAVELSAINGAFELPLRQVPPAQVMVGAPGARVAYGSLILFNDTDGNGDLTLPGRCGNRGTPLPDAGVDTTDGGDGGDFPRPTRGPDETVWGATFRTLLEPQVRIVYQEGAFNEGSFFYPPPEGCTARPPPGFSIWDIDDAPEANPKCAVRDIGDLISIELVDARYANPLRCVPSDRTTFPREFSERTARSIGEDLARYNFECLDDGTIAVVDLSCACREVRTYPLAGCRDEVNCPVPEWDLRANPPAWWPCPVRRGP